MAARPIQIVSDAAQDDTAELEELGKLRPEYDAAKKFIADYDARFKALTVRMSEGLSKEHVCMVPSTGYVLEIKPPSKTRSIKDLPRLIQILGAKLFLQICKVNITDIVKYVPEHQLDEVLETTYGDTRTAELKVRV